LFYLDEVPRETPVQVDAYAGRKLLLQDEFRREQLAQPWTVSLSVPGEAKLSLQDGAIAIAAKDNCFAFAERPLPSGTTLVECEVHSGTDMGATWGTGLALLWPQEVLRINLRSMGTFGVDDGANFVFNGCTQPNTTYRLRVRLEKDEVLAEASHDGEFWEIMHSLPRGRFTGDPVAVRLGKTGPGGRPEDYSTMARPGVSTIRALRVFGAAP
jgi:hypothetical protein